jgi:regulator of protease activity HflC (stomatin/prohibitin superfamily)
MRKLIIAAIVIAIAAAALWYTPQGRGLLTRFGIATADCYGDCSQSG